MEIARKALIWTFGVVGFGFAGAVVGMAANKPDAAFAGFVAGTCIFACTRLWFHEKPPAK